MRCGNRPRFSKQSTNGHRRIARHSSGVTILQACGGCSGFSEGRNRSLSKTLRDLSSRESCARPLACRWPCCVRLADFVAFVIAHVRGTALGLIAFVEPAVRLGAVHRRAEFGPKLLFMVVAEFPLYAIDDSAGNDFAEKIAGSLPEGGRQQRLFATEDR